MGINFNLILKTSKFSPGFLPFLFWNSTLPYAESFDVVSLSLRENKIMMFLCGAGFCLHLLSRKWKM